MNHSSSPASELSPLQAHLNALSTLPLTTTIEAIHSLLPTLTPSITPTATRLITSTDPNLSGPGILNTLGRTYLDAARRCTREQAAFKTRLRHSSLDEPMEDIYLASQRLLKEGLKNGSVKYPPPSEDEAVPCACCRGDPDAVILSGFHEKEAFLFSEDEYERIWGDEETSGGKYSREESCSWASREQVERKAREEEEQQEALSRL